MTYITEISQQISQEPIQKLYEEIQSTLGFDRVPNAFKVSSLDYEISNWIWQGFKNIMLRESSIPRSLKETIALIISKTNSCQYCVQVHSLTLKMIGFDDKKIEDLINNYSNQSEKEKAIFDFVIKITKESYKITKKDHDNLKSKSGLEDNQILEIVSVAGYFNLINRIVDSLGVELEKF